MDSVSNDSDLYACVYALDLYVKTLGLGEGEEGSLAKLSSRIRRGLWRLYLKQTAMMVPVLLLELESVTFRYCSFQNYVRAEQLLQP